MHGIYSHHRAPANGEYSLRHISGPASEPVTLDLIKAQVKLETSYTAEDTLLSQYISAARREVENILNLKIGSQVWDIYLDFWPGDWCGPVHRTIVHEYKRRFGTSWLLPLEPVTAIDSITYTDEDGVTDTVSGSVYGFSEGRNTLFLKSGQSWPSVVLQESGGVVVRVTVGMATCPDNIKQAILFWAGRMYDCREEIPEEDHKNLMRLLGTERVYPI